MWGVLFHCISLAVRHLDQRHGVGGAWAASQRAAGDLLPPCLGVTSASSTGDPEAWKSEQLALTEEFVVFLGSHLPDREDT